MTLEDIVKFLIEAVKDNQEMNGIKNPSVELTTCPMRDLENFDSLNVLEVSTDLEIAIEDKFGTECELNPILFFTLSGKHKLTKTSVYKSLSIKEISDNIYDSINKRG